MTRLFAALVLAVFLMAPVRAQAADFSFIKDQPIATLIALPAFAVTLPFMAADWVIAKIRDASAGDDEDDD